MPLFKSKRISCFFCGEPNATGKSTRYHPNGAVRTFNCANCRADNHLDSKGEIIDYVPESPTHPVQYATPLAQRQSPNPTRPPSPPAFCRTCSHNQQIVSQSIANFQLPDESDPDYEYTANVLFPQHVEEMEARWPQVCVGCKPKVQEIIRNRNYSAKVASLGHMRVRTDAWGGTPSSWDPRTIATEVLWWLRGGIWIAGGVLFVLWHGVGMIYPRGGAEMMYYPTWQRCVMDTWEASNLSPSCKDMLGEAVGKLFLWTLPGTFWIYRNRELKDNPEKKLVGFSEYMKIEIAITLMRFFGWMTLVPGGPNFTEEAAKRIHILFFFLSVISSLIAATCLKLESSQVISFKEGGSPPRPTSSGSTISPPLSPQRMIGKNTSSLRNELSRQRQQQKPPPMLPPVRSTQPIPQIKPAYRDNGSPFENHPTPNLNMRQRGLYQADDGDEMDWDPTSPYKKPPPNPKFSNSTFAASMTIRRTPEPSPFASLTQQTLPFNSTPGNTFHQSSTSPTLFSTSSAPRPAPIAPPSHEGFRRLQDPRWQPIPDPVFKGYESANQETGVESLFDAGLKIDDTPPTPNYALRIEREDTVSEVARMLLAVGAAAAAILGGSAPWMSIPAMFAVICVLAWRVFVPQDGRVDAFSILVGIGSFTVAALPGMGWVGESVIAKAGMAVWIPAVAREMWGLLKRLERDRSRRYHRLEKEMQIKRRLEEKRRQEVIRSRENSPLRMFGGR